MPTRSEFYFGLDEHNRQMVDVSCSGSFLYKTPEEVWELFEHLSENYHFHATSSHSIVVLVKFHIQLTFLVKLML